MPTPTAGRITKKKAKPSTPHQKNHRWESFTTKISKLHSLDPIKKVRRYDLNDAGNVPLGTSYFGFAVQKWSEMNISKSFVNFRREVYPLCETLPQILHFEDRIWSLIAQGIEGNDTESLEALLDCMTAFAHDLGVRFKKYFPKALELIVFVASHKQNADVIEWTFGALAFLFKYLSKLIVPDMRSTYDVLSPLLGKAKNPPHIARFTAEAISYLVKKAAAPSMRETSLHKFITHVQKDLYAQKGERQFTLFKDGIMTMFAEACKGTSETVHSNGSALILALLKAVPSEELALVEETIWTDISCGVLTSVLHFASLKTMREPIQQICEYGASQIEAHNKAAPWKLLPLLRIYSTLVNVRKGYRVTEWPLIVMSFMQVIEKISASGVVVAEPEGKAFWNYVIFNCAMLWKLAPIDALITSIMAFANVMNREPFVPWFIQLCSLFAEMDAERFKSLFLKPFQSFVVTCYTDLDSEELLCLLIPRLLALNIIPNPSEKEGFVIPHGWQAQIIAKFEELEVHPFPERGAYDKDLQTWSDRCLPKYAALLQVLESCSVHPSTNARIAELMLKKLKLSLRPSTSLEYDEVHFIVSRGFRAYLQMNRGLPLDASLQPLLQAALPRFGRSIGFLESLLSYEQQLASQQRQGAREEKTGIISVPIDIGTAVMSLISNLSTSSHEVRYNSLLLLREFFRDLEPSLEALNTMISIENTPLELANTRTIGMLMRKLGICYASITEPWLQEAIPAFLFGSLTVKLAPAWDYAVEAMQKVAESKVGELHLSSLAFSWLSVPSPKWSGPATGPTDWNKKVVTDFECTNIAYSEEISSRVFTDVSDAVGSLLQAFDERQTLVNDRYEQARSRALKVFISIPSMTEAKSRQFVPYFLSWSVNNKEADEEVVEESGDAGKSWSLFDRKQMLKVMEQFQNPMALFQHEKVYQALLTLLGNGDADIQRLALHAILCWKQPGVKPYAERLEALLDDGKFKNVLTLLMQGEQEIQPSHRDELMPVLLRLLYGRTISKKGIASGRNGLQATRLAVLRNLSVEDLGSFIEIALGALKGLRVLTSTGDLHVEAIDKEVIPVRQQFGFLNMAFSFTNELGTSVLPYVDTLVNAVLYCLFFSVRRLRSIAEEDMDIEEAEEANGEVPKPTETPSNTSLLRSARTAGLKCLISLFRNAPSFEWTPYAPSMVGELISLRLPKLPIESTQGVSNMMQLINSWSQLPCAAVFLAIDAQILPTLAQILTIKKAKDNVKIFSLRVFRNLVHIAELPASEVAFNELVKVELLEANLDTFLAHIIGVLEGPGFSAELLEACVDTIISLAPLVSDNRNIRAVLSISICLLNQPPGKVPPRTKGKLLLVLERFVALEGHHLADVSDLSVKIREVLAKLFSYFKDRDNRNSLCRVLTVLAQFDKDFVEVAELCTELNAYEEGLSDEADYNRRLVAYTAITKRETPFSAAQWLPILNNLVFFLKFDEEYGILTSNSADCLRRFIETVATSSTERLAYELELRNVVLPALYTGARELSETVRRECLRVMGHMLVQIPEWGPISDLAGLRKMEEGASEPIFFFNLLSPSMAKQQEAFDLLVAANKECEISSTNLSSFFIPLLEHFIFNRGENVDLSMGAKATTVLAELAKSLEFRHYRSIFLRYIGHIEKKPDFQKQNIRLMRRLTDSLMTAWKLRKAISSAIVEVNKTKENDDKPEDKSSAETMNVDIAPAVEIPARAPRLTYTLPEQEKLNSDITTSFLPPMMKHLHEKDESEVSYRTPVGVIIVKLLVLLPENDMSKRLAPVLTDICHILRSKAWESREMARETLVQIAVILGAKFFGFILKELQSALKSGYQLHVLSYTMHSLLLAVIPVFGQGSLDYCLSSMVTVIMDDIFGITGAEKDADGYNTSMKEIKSSKSQDSMELIAKTASITHLVDLIEPAKEMLLQKVDLRIVRKIDALLSRVSAGLIQNPAANSRDSLMFCYEVIKAVYASQKVEKQPKMDPKTRRYLIVKGAKKSDRGSTTKHTYKLVRFALDLLRAVTKRFDNLRTAQNLTGFLPIMGDGIVDGEEEVKISVFKLLVTISKVPFPSTNKVASVYKVAVKEATKTISQAPSTTTEAAQAALKFLSIVLRDCLTIEVRTVAIDVLVEKLKDDLTNPLYRHITFSFLRAVLDRKIETAAVYDILDYIGTVMITNPDKDTRDLARGTFFQFLKDYPQKKARWDKQIRLIVTNLQYDREGGRISVMEIIHLLLQKSANEFVQEVIGNTFLPLILTIQNDDSEKCRAAASELVKQIWRRTNSEHATTFLNILRQMISNTAKPAVMGLGIQVFGLYFDSNPAAPDNKKDLKLVLKTIASLLPDKTPNEEILDADMANIAIDTIRYLTTRVPEVLLSPTCAALWTGVAYWMPHPENAVKLNASRVISQYLSDFAANTSKCNTDSVMLGSYGLFLTSADIVSYARLALRILNTHELEEELANTAGDMLVFLGQSLAETDGDKGSAAEEKEAEDDEEQIRQSVEAEVAAEKIMEEARKAEEAKDGDKDTGQKEDDKEESEKEDEEIEEATETAPAIPSAPPTDPEVETDSLETTHFTLHFLFKKLSFILRRESAPYALAIYPKVAAINTLQSLCRRLSPSSFPTYLKVLIFPLQHLTDHAIPSALSIDKVYKQKHEYVKTRATILMEFLKKRVGVSEYTRMVLEVRSEVKARRAERQAKRKIEAVTMPEKWGRDKRKKFERKKAKRAERGKDYKAMRQSYKGW